MENNNLKKSISLELGDQENFEIRIANTLEEKNAIYKFRYKVYVEEMEKYRLNVDYENEEIKDELDEWAILVYAKCAGKIISVVRINIGSERDFSEEIKEVLLFKEFQKCYDNKNIFKFVFITKLMVANEYRSSMVLYKILYRCFEIFCNDNVDFVFGACNFHLIRLYEKMGFHRYKSNFFDKEYGLLSAIVTLTGDIEHFRKIKSLFYRMLRKKKITNQSSVKWFYENFIEGSNNINSQLVSEDELWIILCNKLNGLPTRKMAILNNLSIEEAKIFLHSCACIVNCRPNEVITVQGEISYSYNVLLSGKLKSLTFINPNKEYSVQGEQFGVNGLTVHNKYVEDIVTITSAEILVFSGIDFGRFSNTHFDIAHKIVSNLLKI